MIYIILFILLGIPVSLTIWNIITFVKYAIKKEEKNYVKTLEIIAMILGMTFTLIYIWGTDITFESWNKQLYDYQLHSIISPENFPTIMVLGVIGFISYCLLRFIPTNKQPPLLLALGISGLYIEIAICILWIIQTMNDIFLIILPANCILIFIKVILITVTLRNKLIQNGEVSIKYKKLSEFLNKSTNLPIVALILLIPLLGIVIVILFLFGQEPSSIIKAWTETADWTLSQRIPPENISYDGHYLCTVAAGGHTKVVKPTRNGIRHGNSILVNRQLCVANAFEQVLEEKTPKTHKIIRKIYDNTGYPISKHIKSKITADIIYFIMKPLEWFFIIVLYLVDVNPEDRIAVQYPHKTKPN